MKLVQRMISLWLIWILVCGSSRLVTAQSLITTPPPTSNPIPTTRISSAVILAANTSMTATANKLMLRSATPVDLQGTITAVSTLFANMKETGVTPQLQATALANQTSFLNQGFTEAQIESQYASISKAGMKLTLSDYRNALITNQTERENVINTYKTIGIEGAMGQFITRLKSIQSSLVASQGGPSRTLLPASYRTNMPHLVRVDVAGTISTCEVAAAVFGFGSFWFPPLILVAAIYAFEAALHLC